VLDQRVRGARCGTLSTFARVLRADSPSDLHRTELDVRIAVLAALARGIRELCSFARVHHRATHHRGEDVACCKHRTALGSSTPDMGAKQRLDLR
jgi:hypothetical protein